MWSSGSDGSEQKAVLILCVPSSAFSVVNESKLFNIRLPLHFIFVHHEQIAHMYLLILIVFL